jgi:HSP20 family molecular chaperone IbpA
MSITKSKPANMQENTAVDSKPKYKIAPRYGVWSKNGKITIQIAIPGVQKDNIDMKVLPNYFTLRAKRDEVLYALDLELTKVEPEISKASYSEGLLKIELKRYNPMDHAYDVKIE